MVLFTASICVLRPFGDSGPLVLSFAAFEDYYQEQGRDWERYAMLKARILNPVEPFASELNAMLKPFVYRRYIDYSAIESLRRMKQLIEQENRRRNRVDNIKLGAGGIREVEFIVQNVAIDQGGGVFLRCNNRQFFRRSSLCRKKVY